MLGDKMHLFLSFCLLSRKLSKSAWFHIYFLYFQFLCKLFLNSQVLYYLSVIKCNAKILDNY